jgi:ubiquinone/menaquinone biosynthesis C-methylase UbiE
MRKMAVTNTWNVQQQKRFWKGATQEDAYEYLVDGPSAMHEIRHFHESEEAVLMNLLQKHISKKEKIAFIEIGCGPGRVIRKVVTHAFENPETWGACVRRVIGVDFELTMIKKAISSLILKERTIRDWHPEGTASYLSNTLNEPVKSVKEELREKTVFINADAEFPFLRVSGVTPIVALMFGTLGNIHNFDSALANVAELCKPHGKALVVVFDKERIDLGQKRYDTLAKNIFPPLCETEWIKKDNAFESQGGFYSRWFSEDEFKELLSKHFKEGFEICKISKTGLASIVKPKNHFSLKNIIKRNGSEGECFRLLNPTNGKELNNETLPLKQKEKLKNSDGNKFHVQDIMGFRVPIMVGASN